MTPATAQPAVWGNYHTPCAAPGVFQNSTPARAKLWGSNVRLCMGIIQITSGVVGFALGIAVACIHDFLGSGIWTGVFAIVTGFLGVFSWYRKCMVIAYMVCSIIAALMGVVSCIFAGIGAAIASDDSYHPGIMSVYITVCIVSFAQTVISIIGASFTCGALSSRRNQPQQMIYYTPQQISQHHFPAPPYTVNTTPNGPTFQTTEPSPTGADAFANKF